MNAWPTKRMDELCEITSSKRIFAADYVSEGVPFYRGKEITEKHKGKLDISTELFISENKFSEIERKFGAPRSGRPAPDVRRHTWLTLCREACRSILFQGRESYLVSALRWTRQLVSLLLVGFTTGQSGTPEMHDWLVSVSLHDCSSEGHGN